MMMTKWPVGPAIMIMIIITIILILMIIIVILIIIIARDRSEWPVGPGQLTAKGKRMHFHLGKVRNPHLYNDDDHHHNDKEEREMLMLNTKISLSYSVAEEEVLTPFGP